MDIIVKNSITPVHSFDLWGTLVIQETLGPRVLSAYDGLMQGRESPEKIAENIRNYNGVLRGDKKALGNKKEYVNSIEDPLWEAYAQNKVNVNFEGALYQDALDVMNGIAEAGEGLTILTTGNSPWVRQAIMSLNPLIAERLRKVYSGNKAEAQAYESAALDIIANGGQMVSHTEDQLKGLAGILQSDLKDSIRLIYVERANLSTPEEVMAKGIEHYVRDLRDVKYVGVSK